MKENKLMSMLVQEYLDFKRKLGFDLRNEGKELFRFARFAEKLNHKGALTVGLALKWAKNTKKKTPRYWARRLKMVRCFAEYSYLHDQNTEIPSKNLLGTTTYQRLSPYIYTDNEIIDLFNAANEFDFRKRRIDIKTYQTILGLLVCTGIRISEALQLTVDDMDLQNEILTIKETKFHKSRILPIHSSTKKVLEQYIRYRKKYYSSNTKILFLYKNGRAVIYDNYSRIFKLIRNKLGLTGNTITRKPRVHDIRHTFAVKTLLR